jgi:hypothetical protein
MVYATGDALIHDLEALHLDFLIVDRSLAAQRLPYWQQVATLIGNYPDRLKTVFSTSLTQQTGDERRPIIVYQLRHHRPGPAKRLRIDLTYSLGKTLVEAP